MYKKLFTALTLLLSFYNTAYSSPVDLDIHPNLWITNLQGKLVQSASLDNSAADLSAYSCAISGNSLYTVGGGLAPGGSGEDSTATLWISNLNGDNVKTVILDNSINNSIAFDCVILGNTLYTVGFLVNGNNTQATLWITNLGNNSTQAVALDTSVNSSAGYSCVILGNALYTVGELNNGNNSQATLWVTNLTNDNIQAVTLDTSLNNSVGHSCVISGNSLYTVGFLDNDTDSKATLWVTNLTNDNIQAVTLDTSLNNSVGHSCVIAGNSLYTVGELNNASNFQATLWITPLNDINNTQPFTLDNSVNGSTGFSCVIVGNSLYTVGVLLNGTNIQATLWVTDLGNNSTQAVTLDTSLNNSVGHSCVISGNSLYIVGYGPLLTPLTNTLLKGIRAFSPIKFIKALQ